MKGTIFEVFLITESDQIKPPGRAMEGVVAPSTLGESWRKLGQWQRLGRRCPQKKVDGDESKYNASCGGFPKMGVIKNRWFIIEHPIKNIKMDHLGLPPF